jgi:hypothetical protein
MIKELKNQNADEQKSKSVFYCPARLLLSSKMLNHFPRGVFYLL